MRLTALSFLILVLNSVTTLVAGETRPNILFLFADDYTYEAVRAFGLTDIDTPNLDKLAARGVTFTHAYNMGSWSGAVCVASRTMLNTGRSVWQAHKVYDKTDNEREKGVMWSQLMSAAGYRTYMTGKWHVKTDAAKIFDVARDIRPGMPNAVKSTYNRPLENKEDTWSPYDTSLGGFWQGGTHWSEVVANNTLDFLKDASSNEKPFFMYIAFNAPHDPRQSPKEYVDRYPESRIELPVPFMAEYPYAEMMGSGKGLRDEKLAPFPRTEHAVKIHRREYYALIEHLDAQIGRILTALEASGKADNTWIFFTADHGLSVGHHGLFGKQNQYDHSIRVPFMVAGPGVPVNQKRKQPIYLQDVMATALGLANAQKPDHVFYHDIRPLINDENAASPYPSIYGSYLKSQRAIIHDGWKLIVYPKGPVELLYHVAEDPQEERDLAKDPAQAERLKDLRTRLAALSAELGDTLP